MSVFIRVLVFFIIGGLFQGIQHHAVPLLSPFLLTFACMPKEITLFLGEALELIAVQADHELRLMLISLSCRYWLCLYQKITNAAQAVIIYRFQPL